MSELRRISPLRGADPQFSVMELHVSEGRRGGGGLSRGGRSCWEGFSCFALFFFTPFPFPFPSPFLIVFSCDPSHGVWQIMTLHARDWSSFSGSCLVCVTSPVTAAPGPCWDSFYCRCSVFKSPSQQSLGRGSSFGVVQWSL